MIASYDTKAQTIQVQVLTLIPQTDRWSVTKLDGKPCFYGNTSIKQTKEYY